MCHSQILFPKPRDAARMARRDDGVRVVDCGYCGGTGVEGVGNCPACRGSGRHKFRLRRGERLERCRPCGGSGHHGAGLCSNCGGSGWDVI